MIIQDIHEPLEIKSSLENLGQEIQIKSLGVFFNSFFEIVDVFLT
jgi:hypothetical protein